jgi:hypothetical protein
MNIEKLCKNTKLFTQISEVTTPYIFWSHWLLAVRLIVIKVRLAVEQLPDSANHRSDV